MNGPTEPVTVAKDWRQWADPRPVVLGPNNRDLGDVSWERRAMEGEPPFAPSREPPDVPSAR